MILFKSILFSGIERYEVTKDVLGDLFSSLELPLSSFSLQSRRASWWKQICNNTNSLFPRSFSSSMTHVLPVTVIYSLAIHWEGNRIICLGGTCMYVICIGLSFSSLYEIIRSFCRCWQPRNLPYSMQIGCWRPSVRYAIHTLFRWCMFILKGFAMSNNILNNWIHSRNLSSWMNYTAPMICQPLSGRMESCLRSSSNAQRKSGRQRNGFYSTIR